jgi:hypothetical protein
MRHDGKVWPRLKRAHWSYLGFRAVEDNPATIPWLMLVVLDC